MTRLTSSSAITTPSSGRLGSRLFLVGMMGSGKTTVGRLLAEHLGWEYVDSDDQVCRNTGRSVRQIFESEGEAAFRREEKKALQAAATAGDGHAVVAVAGGAVLDAGNRHLLESSGTVVWLDAPPEVLARRVAAGRDHRPLLGDHPAAALARLDRERRPLYAEVADVVVDAASASPAEVVEQILRALA